MIGDVVGAWTAAGGRPGAGAPAVPAGPGGGPGAPGPGKAWMGTTENAGGGVEAHASATWEGLCAKMAGFCRDHWGMLPWTELDRLGAEAPASDASAVEAFMAGYGQEGDAVVSVQAWIEDLADGAPRGGGPPRGRPRPLEAAGRVCRARPPRMPAFEDEPGEAVGAGEGTSAPGTGPDAAAALGAAGRRRAWMAAKSIAAVLMMLGPLEAEAALAPWTGTGAGGPDGPAGAGGAG